MKQNLIYDIGLHKGEDTAFYLKLGYNVIAIEANPDLVQYCHQRFAEQIKTQQLVIIYGALTDPLAGQEGVVTFYKNNTLSEWGTIDPLWVERNRTSFNTTAEEISVPIIRLDDILRKYGCPYFMKIDIEGADMFCLDYLKLIDDKPQFLSIESNKVNFSKLIEEFNTLSNLGYTKYAIAQQATIGNSTYNVTLGDKTIQHTFEISASGLFGELLNMPWVEKEVAIAEYKWIFKFYKLFGDNSIFMKSGEFSYMYHLLQQQLGEPLAGWYDTHARLY